jgi:hypothetical protein
MQRCVICHSDERSEEESRGLEGLSACEGGYSNLLYRVTGPSGHWTVKFTVRDRRDRAGREYHALLALRQAGLSVAPEPLLLDRRRCAQPVVVQTWLEGEVSSEPPSTERTGIC